MHHWCMLMSITLLTDMSSRFCDAHTLFPSQELWSVQLPPFPSVEHMVIRSNPNSAYTCSKPMLLSILNLYRYT